MATKLKPGELRYKGRKVNPATFKTQGIDLRRLTGRCNRCGQLLRGKAARPHPDPFNSEINDNYTPIVQCGGCDHDSCMEI